MYNSNNRTKDKEEDIKELERLDYLDGAKFIHTYMSMTLRENQRDYYFNKLDQNINALKEKYIKYYSNKYNRTKLLKNI